jgi:uncharacterized SAM-binding protein YcdF (DUF218 family)
MEIFFSKFIPLLIYPVGLTAILLILGLSLRKKRRLAFIVILVALMVLWIGGNKWVAMGLARSLEYQYLPSNESVKVDVIVLLGGGTEPAEYPRQGVELNSAGDRVLTAWKLYNDGIADNLLLSGGDISFLDSSAGSPADDMRELLLELGVPDEAMWLDATSQNTFENAVHCKQILADKGIHRILLVTSALHMPRAVKLFEAQELEVIPAPTDYIVTNAGWDTLWHGDLLSTLINIFPTASNLSLTTGVLKEYIGMGYYDLTH